MAWIEPKIDWNTAYEPSTNDFNRIEFNILNNRNIINTNADNIGSETNSRISGDNLIDSKIDNVNSIINNMDAKL